MQSTVLHRAAWAAVLALPAAVILTLLVENCGSIHGSPSCGPLSFLAVPLAVLTLMLDSMVFPWLQFEQMHRMLTWVVAYGVAFVLCLGARWLMQKVRGEATRR